MDQLDLNQLAGVAGGSVESNGSWKKVTASVTRGALALRTKACYDDNVIAQVLNGETFQVNDDKWQGSYVWASVQGLEGWINADYLLWL